ncbi:MAG: hypothetical protein SWE60_01865 [Thermodesulfobacteriota bacterium]|nr:hypothetical protein [Thermodesulfobacteriota bacterium]
MSVLLRQWSPEAKAVVEKIQKRYWDKAGLSRQEFLDRLAFQVLEDREYIFGEDTPPPDGYLSLIMERIGFHKNESLPTDYENPVRYHQVAILANLVEDTCHRLGFDLAKPPLIGTIYSSDVNAHCVKIRSTGEYVLLVCDRLFLFYYLMFKVFVLCGGVPSVEQGDIYIPLEADTVDENLENSPDIVATFLDVMKAFLLHGDPGRADKIYMDINRLTSSRFGQQIMCLFALAHDYGHIVKGHYFAGGDADIVRSHMDEVDADLTAMHIALSAFAGFGQPTSVTFSFIFLYMAIMVLTEKCYSMMKYGSVQCPEIGVPHPPFELRLMGIMANFSKLVEGHEDIREEALKLCESYTYISGKLWSATQLEWSKMCLEGKIPAIDLYERQMEVTQVTVMDIRSLPFPSSGCKGCGHLKLNLIGPALKEILMSIEANNSVYDVIAGKELCPICGEIVSGIGICVKGETLDLHLPLFRAFVKRMGERIGDSCGHVDLIPIRREDEEILLNPLRMGFTAKEIAEAERRVVTKKDYYPG